MNLMTHRQLNEEYGIQYDRLRYLVKKKRIAVLGYSKEARHEGLYDADSVLKYDNEINTNISEGLKRRSKEAIATPEAIVHKGRVHCTTKRLMRELGVLKGRLDYLKARHKIRGIGADGTEGAVGDNLYYDREKMTILCTQRLRAVKGSSPARESSPEEAPKSVLEYRAEGMTVVWIAKRLGMRWQDVVAVIEGAKNG